MCLLVAGAAGSPGGALRPGATPEAEPVPPPTPRGPSVALTLDPSVPHHGTAEVRVLSDDGVLFERQSALPVTIEIPREEPALVVVEIAGFARFSRWVRFEHPGTLRIPLVAGARLDGVVVDDRGDPIASAQVRVDREDETQPAWSTTTDEAGRFMFDTLHAGALAVRVSAPGHSAVTQTDVQTETGAPDASPDEVSLRIMLERVGSIAGRVVTESGEPRAGATIVVAGSGLWPARQVQTDSAGRFVLSDVPPGVYEARAHAGLLVAEPRRGLEVTPRTRSFLTFTLRPGAALSGIIVDSETGAGIAGAEITVAAEALDAAPRAALSGEDGRFTISGLRRVAHRVSVHAIGYVPVTALEHRPGDPLEISLLPGGTLVGVVLDADRRPVVGATLEVLGEDADRQPVHLAAQRGFRAAVFTSQLDPMGMALDVTDGPIPEIPPAPGEPAELGLTVSLPTAATERRLAATHLSDSDGRFRIEGVPPGRVQVVARHPGLAPATTARLYLAASATRDDLELILEPAGRVTGRVLDEREAGVEGVLVEVRSDREPHPRVAFTDLEGRFALEAVVGEITITARPNGRPAARARATVEPGEQTPVTLHLDGALHRLFGRVVDARGFPIAAAQVSVRSLSANAPHRSTVFGAEDGTFTVAGLPAGPWRIETDAPGFATSRADVFDTEEEAQIQLDRGARIAGQLVDDRSGEPVAGRVTLIRGELPPERLTVRAGPGGSWSVRRARAAEWRVEVEAEGYLSYASDVQVIDRGRGPDDVELDPIRLIPGGRAEGTVVDALGHVVPRAIITAISMGPGASTRADARGRFSLRGLPGGSVTLTASHPAAGESEPEVARILVGRETPGLVIHLPERFDATQASALSARRRGVAVRLFWSEGLARIRAVVADSRADLAGLRAGDVLLTIDGEVPSDLRHARRLLRGAPSVGAVLRVQRGELETTLHVRREVWLPD